MSSREEILERIRAAVPSSPAVDVPRMYRQSAPVDIEQFVGRVEDYRATVHRTSASGLDDLLARLLPPGAVAAVAGLGGAEPDGALSIADLAAIPAAVTTCAVAIAETGTVVLDGGPGQGRRAFTLVPDRHVIVVRAEQVVATVPEAIARLDPRRPQTWISGPSATSDIELERVEGVHGPRRLDVVLVVEEVQGR